MRVLHLVGSAETEFFADLSRLYAADCLEATAGLHTAVIAYVTPDRRWRFPADLTPSAIAAAPSVPLSEAVRHIERLRVDVMLPQMFCLPGMTTYRALFDALRIPYVGNPPDVMALGADKAKARAVVAAAGVDVPEGEVLRVGERSGMSPPVVVKPVDADNSLGITLVRSPEEYPAALAAAFAHSDRVLVERYVELGREVRCGVVVRDGELVCLPLEEYAMGGSPVRRYADKIARADDGGLGLVAKDATRAWIVEPSDPVTEAVWAAARTCHEALGCRHYSLFDFRVDPDGRPWFLEAGLYCSFARKSVVVMMAEAAGIPVDELFTGAVRQALA
jgi:D-alanine-D-alanine ligase